MHCPSILFHHQEFLLQKLIVPPHDDDAINLDIVPIDVQIEGIIIEDVVPASVQIIVTQHDSLTRTQSTSDRPKTTTMELEDEEEDHMIHYFSILPRSSGEYIGEDNLIRTRNVTEMMNGCIFDGISMLIIFVTYGIYLDDLAYL